MNALMTVSSLNAYRLCHCVSQCSTRASGAAHCGKPGAYCDGSFKKVKEAVPRVTEAQPQSSGDRLPVSQRLTAMCCAKGAKLDIG